MNGFENSRFDEEHLIEEPPVVDEGRDEEERLEAMKKPLDEEELAALEEERALQESYRDMEIPNDGALEE